ncbi:hypothetical protein ACSQ67_020206 [Phaseolus vulgaris]
MSSHLIEKNSSGKEGCSKSIGKLKESAANHLAPTPNQPSDEAKGPRIKGPSGSSKATGNVLGGKANPGGKNCCRKVTGKANDSVANSLVSNPPSEPPKGSKIIVRK